MDEPVAIQGEPSDPDRNASCTIGGGLSTHVLRLVPGSEILSSLQDYVRANNLKAAFVMTAVGSVTKATLRFAHDPATGNEKIRTLNQHLEILSLVGTISEGSHLHIALGDITGNVIGGHVMGDLIVFTTCEVVIGECTGWKMLRPFDPQTGFPELKPEKDDNLLMMD